MVSTPRDSAHPAPATDLDTRRELELRARLIESVGEALIATDPHAVVTHWNAAAAELTGFPESEAIGTSLLDLVEVEDRSTRDAALSAAAAGTRWSGEVEIRRRDGHSVPVQAFANPVLDGGELLAVIITAFDIRERRTREERAQARARRHATLAELSQRILRDRDVGALLTAAADAVRDALGVDTVGILTRRADGVLVVRAVAGTSSMAVGEEAGPDEIPLAQRAMTNTEPLTVQDLIPGGDGRSSLPDNARSAVASRIRCQDEQEGALLALWREPRSLTGEEADFLDSVTSLLAVAMDTDRAERDLQYLALHDSLTGLPNRTLFRDRLEQALRRRRREGSGLAVLFCDLDRFKLVNDALGHSVGDQLLQEVARRLTDQVRPGDTVARLGGDEFAVLCDGIDDAKAGLAVAERMTHAVARAPVELAGAEVVTNISIGVAACLGDDHCDVDTLLRDADSAMYRAKDRGRGRAELFEDAHRGELVERFELTTSLRSALDRNEFRLVYQPEVALDGATVWIEALLRWNHPTRGELDPSVFMDAAEETGEIVDIGAWAVQTALAHLAEWRRLAPEDAPACISVNLSARQIQDPDLVTTVRSALRRQGIEPEALWFEITETAVLAQPARAVEVLTELKSLGVGLAIDDFGTGYSSLTYAQRLPVDALKIDRSFVSGAGSELRNRTIAEAVIGLAHALDLIAIAEGVETEEQLERLRAAGCDFGQGYLWARPLAPEAVPDWVAGHRAART